MTIYKSVRNNGKKRTVIEEIICFYICYFDFIQSRPKILFKRTTAQICPITNIGDYRELRFRFQFRKWIFGLRFRFQFVETFCSNTAGASATSAHN